MDESFIASFSKALLSSAYDIHADNVDPYRFPELSRGPGRSLLRAVKNAVLQLARRTGFVYVDTRDLGELSQNLGQILYRADGLGKLYQSLNDEQSQQMLISILVFWVLGNRRVKLPRNQPSYWATVRHIERDLLLQRRTIPIQVLDGYLNAYDLHVAGFPIRLHAHVLNILNTFVLQQYRYSKARKVIQARPGDVVIDGGGCWGDTALYFAYQVQSNGRVICFEFAPGNLAVLQANLEMNPNLSSRVRVVREALWDRSGELLRFKDAGPCTTVVRQEDAELTVPTLAIDDLVAKERLESVDFIKLDVEGAELLALKGAKQTLKQFRSTLAISLYHNLDDFVTIPAFLRELEVGYEFYLDHFTIHREETVLFAQSTAG